MEDPVHWWLHHNRSVAVSDVPQLFAGSWLYQLPIGTGQRFQTGNRYADYAIGNWQINGILSLQAGEPYNVYISSDIANIGILGSDEGERPNIVGSPYVYNRKPTAWFNTAAYQAPAPFTFGTLGRNTGRTDWGRNLDLSLFSRVSFHGVEENRIPRGRLQFHQHPGVRCSPCRHERSRIRPGNQYAQHGASFAACLEDNFLDMAAITR